MTSTSFQKNPRIAGGATTQHYASNLHGPSKTNFRLVRPNFGFRGRMPPRHDIAVQQSSKPGLSEFATSNLVLQSEQSEGAVKHSASSEQDPADLNLKRNQIAKSGLKGLINEKPPQILIRSTPMASPTQPGFLLPKNTDVPHTHHMSTAFYAEGRSPAANEVVTFMPVVTVINTGKQITKPPRPAGMPKSLLRS